MKNIELQSTTSFTEFSLLTTPLHGHNLIEANAGTGKTYTISRLFLRLLLQKEYKPSSILVVTFTDAATQELKERIYLLLREALTVFTTGETDDDFFIGLLASVDRNKAKEFLTIAIHTFDTVAIHTIHGFCQRVLFENSFESGVFFDSTIITEQNSLITEISNDYWRNNFYGGSPAFVAYALQSGLSPDYFRGLSRIAGKFSQKVHILPDITDPDCTSDEAAYGTVFQSVKTLWTSHKSEVKSLLFSGSLKGNTYSDKIIQELITSMDLFLNSEVPSPFLFEKFEKLTRTIIKANTKKGCTVPDHVFFDTCEELNDKAQMLQSGFDQKIVFLKAQFISYINQELTKRKSQKGQLYFDDLLQNVHRALTQDKQSNLLATTLRKTFKVALIDEFQDTDPVQYEIFSSIFTNDCPMFLIGDPKQSIYGFRGADIFTYLQASQRVDARYTLSNNFRSDPEFLSTINTLFGRSSQTFVYNKIEYNESLPGKPETFQQLIINEVKQPSLNFQFVDQDHDLFCYSDKTETICKIVAAKISMLLAENATLVTLEQAKPVTPSHIAILVRTNREAELMQQALADLYVPSVIDSGSSVFDSQEARELERLLAVLVEPNDSALIRAVLSSSLWGMSANEIDTISQNQTAWEDLSERFHHYHDLWRDHGFAFTFRTFLSREHIRPKLLSLNQGERRLTNMLHLSELLHLQEQLQDLGMTGLHAWFLQKVSDSSTHVPDEEMLRLESDYESVSIITVHKSKGLEFSIVFCPFCWHNSELGGKKNEPYIFHDTSNNNDLSLALGSDEIEQNRSHVEKELLAENMRLLYVALTRAKSSCFVIWGKLRSSESSALAYLLHGEDIAEPVVASLKEKVKVLSASEIFDRLNELQVENPSIGIEKIDQIQAQNYENKEVGAGDLECRTFDGNIPDQWRISSFSSLTRNRSIPEMPDHDLNVAQEVFPVEEDESAKLDIFTFPKGSIAGTFLHDVLENIDFSDTESPECAEIIAGKLKNYGFDSKWNGTVLELIKTIAETTLDSKTGLSLSKLTKSDRLNEVEFLFPLKPIKPEDIQKVFSEKVQTDLFGIDYQAERLQFTPSRGFMKGFIDLIFQCNEKFYLIDWKSNHLGNAYSDYDESRLKEEMKADHYILQYHIYLVALNKYLSLRVPNYKYSTHFGGVYYLFLRGLNKSGREGIFYDAPEERMIGEMTELMVGIGDGGDFTA